MDQIYKNAALTIAASASEGCESGIFGSELSKASSISAAYLPETALSSGPQKSVQVVPYSEPEFFCYCLDLMPLAKRGWARQERYLSQRVLHCGSRRFYFQCRSSHLQSNGARIKGTDQIDPAQPLMLDLRLFSAAGKVTTMAGVADVWYDLIETYSRHGTLTRSSDRLPAVAGLVNAIHQVTGDTYLAGIWANDFAKGLMWQRPFERSTGRMSKFEWRAPSWSWAAWDGLMIHLATRGDPLATVANATLLSHEIELSGVNPYGEVKSGFLQLKAWISEWSRDNLVKLGRVWIDEWPSQREAGSSPDELASCLPEKTVTVMMVGLFQKEVDDQINALYGYELGEGKTFEMWGMLLLKPAKRQAKDCYERRGVIVRGSQVHEEFDLTGWKLRDVLLV